MKTIDRAALARLCALNSKKIPKYISDDGVFKTWSGTGWIKLLRTDEIAAEAVLVTTGELRKLIPWTDRAKSTTARSRVQEKRVAKVLEGRMQPRSGAGEFRKADVLSKEFLVECKTTKKRSYTLKFEDLETITHHAGAEGGDREPLFVISFEQPKNYMGMAGYPSRDWAMMPLKVLEGLLADARSNCRNTT